MNRQTLFKLGISVFVLSLISTPSISFAVSNFSYNDVNLVSNANIQLLDIKSHSLQSNENNKVKVSKDRMDAMISFAKENPNLFLAKVISKEKKATLSSLVKSNIEDEVSINGTFVVIVTDDFKNKKETFKYQIRSSDRTYEFYPAGNLKVSSGDSVTVKGYALSNILVARANDVVIKKSPRLAGTTVPDSVGVQRTLVFLVKGNENIVTKLTKEQYKEIIFNGKFSQYMAEQSNGKVSFTGDVYGWDISSDPNLTISNEDFSCNLPNELDRLVAKYKINISDYQRVLYIYDEGFDGYIGGCSTLGKVAETRVNGINHKYSISVVSAHDYHDFLDSRFKNILNDFDFVLSHEMGHGLGLDHSNGMYCKSANISDECVGIEYGNVFDVMGSIGRNYYTQHFNSYYKEMLGWLSSDQIINVNSSGVYEITPQENGSRSRLIKINIENKPQYFIEMRAPYGFDAGIMLNGSIVMSNLSGIFINKIINNKTFLLDMSPNNKNYFDTRWEDDTRAVTLNHPNLNTSLKQFTDINSGITIGPITNVNINNSNSSLSSIKFNVTISPTVCTGTAPAIENIHYRPSLQYDAGDWFSGDLFVISNDSASCGASDFTMKYIDLPEGWTAGSFSPTKLSLSNGEKDSTFYDLKIPNYAYTDDYVIKIEIKSLKTGATKIFEKPIHVNGIPKPIVAKDWIAPTQVKMGSSFSALLNFTGGPSTVSQLISLNFYDKDNILKFSESVVPNKLTTSWINNTSIPATINIPGDVPPGVYKVSLGMYQLSETKRALTGNPYEPVIGTIEVVSDLAKISEIKNSGFVINTPSVNSSTDIPNHVVTPNHSISILPWSGPSAIPVDSSLNYIVTFRGGPTQQNQRVFVHFVDQSGNIKFVSDIIPSTPTTKWTGLMRIPVSVSIPNNVSLGSYKVVAGLYSGNSSVPLVPENGVVVLGNNSNRYQVGTVSILRSASSPGLASTASVIDSVPAKKVETRSVSNTSSISTQTTQVSSTPTRGSSRSNYSSSPATPSPSSTPSPTATPTASPTASPTPTPTSQSRSERSHGSSPTTTASPVTSVPSASVAPAPAPAPVPVSAPAPAPSSTPAPSPSATESI